MAEDAMSSLGPGLLWVLVLTPTLSHSKCAIIQMENLGVSIQKSATHFEV